MLFPRIATVHLPVRELDRAVAWYMENFGIALRWQWQNLAVLDVGESSLTLCQPEGGFQPIGRTLLHLYTTDIKAAHRRLADAGAAVGPIETFPEVHSFEFTDPDGNRLGVYWFPS